MTKGYHTSILVVCLVKFLHIEDSSSCGLQA
jgi:hypothetical protein